MTEISAIKAAATVKRQNSSALFAGVVEKFFAVGFAFDLKCSSSEEGIWLSREVLSCGVENLNITKRGEVMSPSLIDDNNRIGIFRIPMQTVHFIPKFTKLLAKINIFFLSEKNFKSLRE
jgi:hypothetical protein